MNLTKLIKRTHKRGIKKSGKHAGHRENEWNIYIYIYNQTYIKPANEMNQPKLEVDRENVGSQQFRIEKTE